MGAMGTGRSDPLIRVARSAATVAACLILANCASSGKFASRVDPKYGVSSSPRVVGFGEPVPKGGGTYRVGKPYTVAGRVYVPEEDTNYREEVDGTPIRQYISSIVVPKNHISSTRRTIREWGCTADVIAVEDLGYIGRSH